ncbi:MAG: hypothetical protein ACREEC_07275, partial [Thermoplasmata archaeon]
ALNSVTRTLRVGLDEPGMERARHGAEVPVRIDRDGPATSLFVDLRLPSGSVASAEVDTGSDAMILHSRYLEELGVNPDRIDVQKKEGTDETDHRYVRYFTRVHGRVSLAGAPKIFQTDPEVMFQEIIYDGLVGDAFLRTFDVTYDLARSRMIFADPSV